MRNRGTVKSVMVAAVIAAVAMVFTVTSTEVEGLLTYEEYSKHKTADDCWILVNNKVGHWRLVSLSEPVVLRPCRCTM